MIADIFFELLWVAIECAISPHGRATACQPAGKPGASEAAPRVE